MPTSRSPHRPQQLLLEARIAVRGGSAAEPRTDVLAGSFYIYRLPPGRPYGFKIVVSIGSLPGKTNSL